MDADVFYARQAKEFLRGFGALVEDDHVRLASHRHAETYVDHRPLLLDPKHLLEANRYMGIMAQVCRGIPCEVVIGPERGGKVMADLLADHVSKLTHGNIHGLSIAKGEDEAYVLPRATSGRLPGRRVLLVDDVLTKGGTLLRCLQLLRAAGANVVAVAVSWNRGGLTAQDLGVPRLVQLIDEAIPDYAEGPECPGCRRGQPINRRLGHPPDP